MRKQTFKNVSVVGFVFVFCLSLILTKQTNNDSLVLMSVDSTIEKRESQIPFDFSFNVANPNFVVKTKIEEPDTIPTVEKNNYRIVRAMVTAYCPCARCCGTCSPGRTATGTSAWRKGLATDPRAIPYGTEVEIDGYGIFKVDDTGGAMRRRFRQEGIIQIDVRKTYHWQARNWGVRWMDVKVFD